MELIRKLNAIFFINFLFSFLPKRFVSADYFFLTIYKKSSIVLYMISVKVKFRFVLFQIFFSPLLAWLKSYFRLGEDSAKRETTMMFGESREMTIVFLELFCGSFQNYNPNSKVKNNNNKFECWVCGWVWINLRWNCFHIESHFPFSIRLRCPNLAGKIIGLDFLLQFFFKSELFVCLLFAFWFYNSVASFRAESMLRVKDLIFWSELIQFPWLIPIRLAQVISHQENYL